MQVTEIDFGKPKKKRNFLLKHWPGALSDTLLTLEIEYMSTAGIYMHPYSAVTDNLVRCADSVKRLVSK